MKYIAKVAWAPEVEMQFRYWTDFTEWFRNALQRNNPDAKFYYATRQVGKVTQIAVVKVGKRDFWDMF